MSLPAQNILVSFVIATRNRREALIHTLDRLHTCGLDRQQTQFFVVDNASTDATADAIVQHYPHVRLIRLTSNRGSCAKNIALGGACGRYVVFLDDDSFPLPGSIPRMIRHFEADPTLGAAVFTVTLPDGSRECSAYPSVFIGCGTGFRRRALQQVGGLPEDFFMQAEEYDLSLRLMHAGWQIRRFDDLHVSHLKTAAARSPARVMRLDVRNNYVVASRYFPQHWRRIMRSDWMRRYRAIASARGQSGAYWLGRMQGFVRSVFAYRQPLSDSVFEQFARPRDILDRVRRAQRDHAIKRMLLIDWGKNILPYWLAARELGIEVVAIADNRLAGKGRSYRGIAIVNDSVARRLAFDAAIVSNSSPVHAEMRMTEWRRLLDRRPVIDLFDPSWEDAAATNAGSAGTTSAAPAASESRRTAARIA